MKKEKLKTAGGFDEARETVLDALGRSDVIYIFGRKRLLMEGCRKIKHCDNEKISIIGNRSINVYGTNLRLKQLGNGTMSVDGLICRICFDDAGNPEK